MSLNLPPADRLLDIPDDCFADAPPIVPQKTLTNNKFVEQSKNGINPLQLRQSASEKRKVLFELSRQAHERVESLEAGISNRESGGSENQETSEVSASTSNSGANEGQLSELRESLSQARKVEEDAMRALRLFDSGNASFGLSETASSDLVMSPMPHGASCHDSMTVALPPPSRNGDSHAEYIPSSEEPDWEQSTKEKPDKLPPIVDAVEFIAVELPTPPELIKGLLHQGTKMMLGGGSKSFKTWLQMDMAISVASGQPWMGCEVERGKVLFANLELHDSFFHKRLIAICQARGIKLEKGMLDLWNLRGFSASYDVIIPEVIRRTAEKRYVLDFFDPIYKIYGKTDENSAGEVAQLVNSLETLCVQTQACVAFGAHFSKGNQSQKEAIDRTSGSGVWSRDPDTILTFTRHEEEDCFTVESNLRNLPSMPPFVVRWKYPLMVRDDTLDPEKLKQIGGPGKRKEHDPIELLGWIKHTTPVNAMNRSAWAAASGIKDKTLSDYIAEFRSMGYIRTVGEGRFAAYHITEKGLRFINSPL